MGLVKSMAKEMIKEIGNKSREFYEFVLPPVDMFLDNDKLTLLVDLPGFAKKDIKLSLDGNVLSIQACKEIYDVRSLIAYHVVIFFIRNFFTCLNGENISIK